ncbi:MAG: mechanosensitive ion channel domain-containing protein [Flavobacteriaceae bacterium]
MTDFFLAHQREFLGTIIALAILLFVKLITSAAVRKIGKLRQFNTARSRLVNKYVSFGLLALAIIMGILIWGVNLKEIGLIFSSLFAVLGVALFAIWSILSNVTAGIILFLNFPFKIGDRIKILDKEIEYDGNYLIEDIRAYHIHLRMDNGELMTYPNNLMLQKPVVLVTVSEHPEDSDA